MNVLDDLNVFAMIDMATQQWQSNADTPSDIRHREIDMNASSLISPPAPTTKRKTSASKASLVAAKEKPATNSAAGVKKKSPARSRVITPAEKKPRRRRSLTVKIPSWFNLPELAPAVQFAEQLLESCPAPTNSLTSQAKQIAREEIGFITNAGFVSANAAKSVFAGRLIFAPPQPAAAMLTARQAGADLPVHLSRMCEAKLLTPEQESMLFQRMNFLRHQAAMHRSLIDPAAPSADRIALIRKLLAMADWHRDRIVEANTRLVFSIVKKFINANNVFDDLLSDGIVALIRAVEKFDYDRGFRFSTYATQVVRRNAYRQVVQKQQERLKIVGGLQDMDIDVSDEDRGSAISETRWHELRGRLALMLGDLDRREKFIIRARFSLGSHRKVHTLQALADRLGVSKERVRQLERRAMEKLRAMAGEVKLVELET